MATITTPERKTRYRPSPQLYRFTYRSLVERDGESCSICNTGPPLEIDHIDRRIDTWVLSKLRLACKPCNVSLQNVTAPSVKVRERTSEVGDASTEIGLSQEYEPRYRKWLFDRAMVNRPLYTDEAINSGAEFVGCNPQTTRRYLAKACSESGMYELVTVRVENRNRKQVVVREHG